MSALKRPLRSLRIAQQARLPNSHGAPHRSHHSLFNRGFVAGVGASWQLVESLQARFVQVNQAGMRNHHGFLVGLARLGRAVVAR